jgi:hypothetical protein
MDQDKWKDVGESNNPMYVPLKVTQSANACNLFYHNVIYSTLHYACQPAAGLTNLAEIETATYKAFETKKMPRIDKPNKTEGMTYWQGNENNNIADFFNQEDGRCTDWRKFLQHSFAQNGIKGCAGIITPIFDAAALAKFESLYFQVFGTSPTVAKFSILVKTWNVLPYNTFYLVTKKKEYTTPPPSVYTINNITITLGDDNSGIDKAQNTIDPESVFFNHGTVCIGDKIYDPSYGIPVVKGIKNWEKANVSAYAILTTYYDVNTMQNLFFIYPFEGVIENKKQVDYKCQ